MISWKRGSSAMRLLASSLSNDIWTVHIFHFLKGRRLQSRRFLSYISAKNKYIKKLHGKRVSQCICGRYIKPRKSMYTKFDIMGGSILLGIVVVALVIRAPEALAIIVLPIVLLPWTIFFVSALAKGHTSKCAASWAAVVVVGSLGGNWF